MDPADQCGRPACNGDYSRLITGLAKSGVEIDRKSLAELAVRDAAFAQNRRRREGRNRRVTPSGPLIRMRHRYLKCLTP